MDTACCLQQLPDANCCILLNQTEEGETMLDVRLQDETVWLTQAQMVELFQRDKRTISENIHNIFKEGELSRESTMQKMHNAFSDKPIALYSLDLIISGGCRVKSQRGT